jgi:ABC-2 type transport system permease protein
MSLAPASWPWLLRHELRLVWRGLGVGTHRAAFALVAFLWLVYHVALALIVAVTGWPTLTPGLFVLAGFLVWFVCTLMLSQAISLSVGVFFERGDLDLLLASPIAPRNVFLVRGLAVAVSVVAIYALLLAPIADVGLFTGEVALIAIYPALCATGLLVTAIGMAMTIALVRLLGARRARIAAQIVGAFVGAALFLAIQAGNLVAPGRTTAWILAAYGAARGGGWLAHDSLLWLPLNALLGKPLALVVLSAAGVGAFAIVVNALARRFLAGTQESVTTPVRPREERPVRFRGGLWRTVMVKEWKLIGRDPQVIARTLLQSIYLLPLVLVWMRRDAPQAALAPTMVLLAATLASGLVWLTVAAEDAPELLASAPVDRSLLRRAKLAAGLAPVWLIMLPLALVLVVVSPRAAAAFVPCVVGATISAGSLQLAFPRTGRRRDLRRRGKGHPIAGVFELVSMLGWTVTTWLLLEAPAFAPVPAVAAIGAPLVAWRWGRRQREEFTGA